jgi:hypothetical protein
MLEFEAQNAQRPLAPALGPLLTAEMGRQDEERDHPARFRRFGSEALRHGRNAGSLQREDR